MALSHLLHSYSFTNCDFFCELCDHVQFKANYAKSHHRIISVALSHLLHSYSFTNWVFFGGGGLCDHVQFKANYAKSHHRIISDALSHLPHSYLKLPPTLKSCILPGQQHVRVCCLITNAYVHTFHFCFQI